MTHRPAGPRGAHVLALALTALALAGCPAKGTGTLGATCKTGGDCASGDCDTSISGGICTQTCGSGSAACPTGTKCAAAPSGPMECIASCTETTQCPVGDVCNSSGVCLPPTKAVTNCTDSDKCPSGYTCKTASGECVLGALTNVGGACASDSDCTGGNEPLCMLASHDFPNGYCSSVCTENSDCGPNGECLSVLTDPLGNPLARCLEKCTKNSDCSTDYICQTADGASFCFPQDCRANPFICPATQICSSTGTCETRPPVAGYPAAFPAQPQVQSLGGPTLANPKIVGIFFSNDDMTFVSQMEQFYAGIGTSQWWGTMAEYGVDVGSGTNVILDEAAPDTIDDSAGFSGMSALEDWLLTEITKGKVPMPDANTEYMITYPANTTITEGGGASCSSFGGYHADVQVGTQNISYGVIPRCPTEGTGFTELQLTTGAASHEIAEAATDPYPNYDPAYAQCDQAQIFYQEAQDGSEIGDMCEDDPEAFHVFPDFPFTVQRLWSNQSAMAGHDPCQPPYQNEVFFNALPETPNTNISFDYYGQLAAVSGTTIAVGSSGTVTVDLYSDYPTGNWSVSLIDFNYFTTGNSGAALLSFTPPSSTSGQNGSKQTWTVQVNAAGNHNTNGQADNTEVFAILSQQGTGNSAPYHISWGVIGN